MNIKAYAKINLTLDILGLRGDGFHELGSVTAPISLYDNISIEKSDSQVFKCDLPELRGDDNFCVRARDAFFAETGMTQPVTIKLQKHIPYPAGLGGGSADAAAVLNGLNTLFGELLPQEKLYEIGARVGSDVPMCMLGKCALCEGRGEKLTPLSGMPKLYLTVAIGSGRLPTAKVFKEYDSSGAKPTGYTAAFLKALESGDEKAAYAAMGNGFTEICAKLCPETKEMRARLRSCGAKAAVLSGSGPAVYGVFADEQGAMNAARELRRCGFFAVNCETM
ncbi:MAG: 4-(cytidine 5'-diphospho)-2-C-methyl-D-erythritol kinase [Clostridia bacterium]|nr:4-(cytidine 5'-diphospho)-2-C-methyl-D-erythritol kinase [Clostridia bacterium]